MYYYLIPTIKGKAVFIGYTGDENIFTCDAFYGTTDEAENYFSDEYYFKILLFSDLPKSEQEIVINCIPPAQMEKLFAKQSV